MKCFLSHSSKDKGHYVQLVADKLSPNIEYDALTFEEGLGNWEEIISALDRSTIFVAFLSDASLNSDWVKKEFIEAKKRIDAGLINRFFPIVIDRSIQYTDPRIPDWMREEYNLRPITSPVLAARRIRERMIELSWELHPVLKERDRIFVGRNELISKFEQRMDDFQRRQPLVVFASGLKEIGRKSLLTRALRKANRIKDYYSPMRVNLSEDDGLEGFILKLKDYNLSDGVDTSDLLSRDMSEREDICAKLINDLLRKKEILLIEDRNCIARRDREISQWFTNVIDRIEYPGVGICVASSSRPLSHKFIKNHLYYFIEVPELEKNAREGLFLRYCELLDLDLTREELREFSPLLKGFPEQVTFAVDLVSSLGVEGAIKRADEIVSFSSFKAGILLKRFEGDDAALSFLRFISSFEFFSLDFISQLQAVLGMDPSYYLGKFVADSICEMVGSTGQYYRVNEVVRDAMLRDRLDVAGEYKDFLTKFAGSFISGYQSEDYDISEYHIAIKQALVSGINIPERILIPAHFLQAMKELYNRRKYDEVINLADRVMLNSERYDVSVQNDVQYYLCQSLARLKSDRFTEEVQKIKGPEHNFLFGFYYRQKRRFSDSLKQYRIALNDGRTEQRARREIVFVLTAMEDYAEGLSFAKENYERFPYNPFFAQAYFECLLSSDMGCDVSDKLQEILGNLEAVGGVRAEEMHATLSATYEFRYGDKDKAYQMIDRAINAHESVVYPILAKLDMAISDMNLEYISMCIKKMSHANMAESHHNALMKAKCLEAAILGDKSKALRMLDKDLSQLSVHAQDKIRKKIEAVEVFL